MVLFSRVFSGAEHDDFGFKIWGGGSNLEAIKIDRFFTTTPRNHRKPVAQGPGLR